MFCDVCGFIACVCAIKNRHAEDCRFLVSATCPVGIECEHGRDVCPVCDPCTCGTEVGVEDFGPPTELNPEAEIVLNGEVVGKGMAGMGEALVRILRRDDAPPA